MKPIALAWVAGVIVVGSVQIAASQTPAQEQTQRSPAARADAGNSVTLTGCLQTDEKKSVYWLSDASGGPKGTSGSGEASATGRVDDMKQKAMAETYRLNPSAGVALQGHVGHKVQITGSFADDTAAGTGQAGRGTSAGTGTGTGTTGTGGAATGSPAAGSMGPHMSHVEKARRVNVTALKHVSPTCEPGKQ
jgi:hypothetical protein